MNEDIPRGRILVVDDEPHLCWVLSKLLSDRGHDVRTACSRAVAVNLLASGFDCQVAIVDYRLPDSDGIALITEMTSRLPRLQSILMTSYGSASLRQHARDTLFAYVDKPFNNDLLVRTVEDAVRSWKAGDDSLYREGRTRAL